MNATIKVGNREMTVAEARELYEALREVFGDKVGLKPRYAPNDVLEALRREVDLPNHLATKPEAAIKEWTMPVYANERARIGVKQ